ncbi:ABC transporter substrate-binding protein [Singulisphaera sp. PoT]|uniref:ABC transporter substrate-binding protein n=1 Tax=Singulisphaera sp. PoT TaxID=3411797 RepID=UPI003BF6021E
MSVETSAVDLETIPMKLKRSLWLFLASGLVFLGAGCGGSPEPSKEPLAKGSGKDKVVLRLNWYPEVEHGGFFAAQVQGDFAEEGLEVEIQPGGPGSAVIPEVALGRADFGVENADKLLVGRSQDTPVMALLAPLQKFPMCIMTHKSAGFTNLRDLRDVTLAVSIGAPFASYLKKNVALPGTKIVPYEGGVALFLRDPKYAQQGYIFSEPILAEGQGGDPVALPLADIGYNPYSSILIASETLIKDKPELVARMVRACRRGWRRYAEDPTPANAHLAKVNTLIPLDSVTKMSAAIRPLVLADLKGLDEVGTMKPERWSDTLSKLEDAGVIKPGKIKADDAYSLSFLEGAGEAKSPAAEAPKASTPAK